MYSFFDLSSTASARVFAAAGSLIITVAIMLMAIIPATPATALNMGGLA